MSHNVSFTLDNNTGTVQISQQIKKNPLLSLFFYLFTVACGDKHQTRSNGNVLSITTTGNAFVTIWV